MSTKTFTAKYGLKAGDKIKFKGMGEAVTIVRIDDNDNTVRIKREDGSESWRNNNEESFEFVPKTLATLQQDDIILDDDDDEVKVLGVIRPGLYVLSENYDHDQVDAINTAEYLEESGYKVKETTAEPVKLTVAEAAKRLGIETLEIVEG